MSEIDVSDCCYYNGDNSPFCCELYDNECEAQNCYYKQLQQLKVENEGLQSLNDFYVQKIETLETNNDELKKLKDEILNKKPSEREYCKGCTLPAYNKVLDEIENLCKCAKDSNTGFSTLCDVVMLKIKEVKED